MKKNRINAFTLVEMLIVIVIIGILIAALMPRMQSAQGRARDVSRKTALSQIQSAIVTSQGDKGMWPGLCSTNGCPSSGSASGGIAVNMIETELKNAGMNSVPKDPLDGTEFSGLNGQSIKGGQYGYLVTKRNGTENGGFVLMAKTEVEGGSNWVVCEGASKIESGYITNTGDISSITLCNTVTKIDSGSGCISNTGACKYNKESELRYIMVY